MPGNGSARRLNVFASFKKESTYVSLFPTAIAVIQAGKHKYNNLIVLQDQINNNNNDDDYETTATTNVQTNQLVFFHPSNYTFIYSSIHPSLRPPVCISVHPSTHPSIYLSVYIANYLSICNLTYIIFNVLICWWSITSSIMKC